MVSLNRLTELNCFKLLGSLFHKILPLNINEFDPYRIVLVGGKTSKCEHLRLYGGRF